MTTIGLYTVLKTEVRSGSYGTMHFTEPFYLFRMM